MELHNARVLVLGASGFVGQWVARRLHDEGATLWCGVRQPENMRPILSRHGVVATVCPIDVTDRVALGGLFRDVRPHVVFNLVGYGVDPHERDPAVARAVNVELVRDLLDLIPRHGDPAWTGAQLVHTGSALEYGDVGGQLSEEREGHPTSDYGRTKLAGTKLILASAQQSSARALVARLFTVYGPGEHDGRLFPTLLEAARRTERVALTSGSQLRDFTYVEDVARGLVQLAACSAPLPALLNLATGRLASVREFITIAADELGIASERLGFGDVPQRPEEIPHALVTVERLRAALSWAPATTIREGVRSTARFLMHGRPVDGHTELSPRRV